MLEFAIEVTPEAMVMQGSATSKVFPERVLKLCDEHSLIAIVTEPSAPQGAKPGVIMLNAGVLHRVGPHRLHVLLGRELAERGFLHLPSRLVRHWRQPSSRGHAFVQGKLGR